MNRDAAKETFTTNFMDFPLELLIIIFGASSPPDPLSDALDLEPACNVMMPKWEGKIMPAFDRFGHELLKFSRLRLVCRAFNQAMITILYTNLRIILRNSTSCESMESLFAVAAKLAKTIKIYGYQYSSSYNWRHPQTDPWTNGRKQTFQETIGRCLGQCNALVSLQCYGVHPTFPDRAWLTRLAPRLQFTITSFSFTAAVSDGEQRLSHSLVSLGPSLESLEICYWTTRDPDREFLLPPAFPKLKSLVLRDCHPHPLFLLNLFSRIRLSPTSDQVPLRELTLDSLNYPIKDLPLLFSTGHLGSGLTVLKIGLDLRTRHMTTIIHVFQLCPNLLELAWQFSAASSMLLRHLPPRLRRLDISLNKLLGEPFQKNDERLEQKDIFEFIRKVRSCTLTLRSLHVTTSWLETGAFYTRLLHMCAFNEKLYFRRFEHPSEPETFVMRPGIFFISLEKL